MTGETLWQASARGKLLLTGEYAVLDGALALALPVRYGQHLHVARGTTPGRLQWSSLEADGRSWFEAEFALPDLEILQTNDPQVAQTLRQLLLGCRAQNESFLSEKTAALRMYTRVDFPREWGLGTSSTLIALLARVAGADPYAVLFDTLGGSGYDVACAFAEGPLLYRLDAGRPVVQPVVFQPPFGGQLFFVFLGQKQDSREGIRRYRALARGKDALCEELSALTTECLETRTLEHFCRVLNEHEQAVSGALNLPRVQALHFQDFRGVVKSLGAWGGDFVLAAGYDAPSGIAAYFAEKGFSVCIPFREMVVGRQG